MNKVYVKGLARLSVVSKPHMIVSDIRVKGSEAKHLRVVRKLNPSPVTLNLTAPFFNCYAAFHSSCRWPGFAPGSGRDGCPADQLNQAADGVFAVFVLASEAPGLYNQNAVFSHLFARDANQTISNFSR